MVTSSRHGYRNRKPRAHILNRKHKADSEERTYNVKSLSSQNPPYLMTHPLKCPPKADTNWDQVSRCQTMGDISFKVP